MSGAPAAPPLATLEALYDAYHRQALGLACRLLGSREEAEEVVQEAFLAAWRALGDYDPTRGSARTWFLTLVRHRAIDALRARGRRPAVPLEGRAEVEDPHDVSAAAIAHAEGQAVRAALAALPAAQRQALELAYFGGLSHTEIAERLEAPMGTVKGRIRLGLDRLRAALGVSEEHPARA